MKKAIAPHIIRMDDNWGLGQIDLETINKMVEVGDKIGLSFGFARKVTAMDDLTYKEQTVIADKGYLFVYPSDDRTLTDFWTKVDGGAK